MGRTPPLLQHNGAAAKGMYRLYYWPPFTAVHSFYAAQPPQITARNKYNIDNVILNLNSTVLLHITIIGPYSRWLPLPPPTCPDLTDTEPSSCYTLPQHTQGSVQCSRRGRRKDIDRQYVK